MSALDSVAAAALQFREPELLAQVRYGLTQRQKELPSKLFYDRRGSALFEEITHLPEYYLSRAEQRLLLAWAARGIPTMRPRSLVELGAGSAAKTRTILSAMQACGCADAYVPIDISREFLLNASESVRGQYPGLRVLPTMGDITGELHLPPGLQHPILFAFLGSTIGNFDPESAVALLQRVRIAMGGSDRFLLGVDLRKDVSTLEAAYNDSRGVTAEFNLNMLRVLNREFGADFTLSTFRHDAYYDRTHNRIEMHLVSIREQTVTIPGIGQIELIAGESIRTEISCKHDRKSVAELLHAAGLQCVEWTADPSAPYALVLAALRSV